MLRALLIWWICGKSSLSLWWAHYLTTHQNSFYWPSYTMHLPPNMVQLPPTIFLGMKPQNKTPRGKRNWFLLRIKNTHNATDCLPAHWAPRVSSLLNLLSTGDTTNSVPTVYECCSPPPQQAHYTELPIRNIHHVITSIIYQPVLPAHIFSTPNQISLSSSCFSLQQWQEYFCEVQ